MKNISCNQKQVLNIIKLVLICSLLMILLWVGKWLVHIFWFDTFVVPSNSMMPTLQPGDKIIADKLCFGARIYRNFHFDKQGVELQCFRMKGMGDLRRNDVFVFNKPVINHHITFVINYVYCKRCIGLPGDSVSIRNGYYLNNNFAGNLGCVDNQTVLRVHDYYFAGGDNVVDSHDSRYWGLVPDIYIIGIVKRIEYSKARVTGKYDWRRFLRCVK